MQDLELLEQLKKDAVNDSIEVYRVLKRDEVRSVLRVARHYMSAACFLKSIKRPGGVLPSQQVIATVPDIDWTKYSCSSTSSNSSITEQNSTASYNTRKKRTNSMEGEYDVMIIPDEKMKKKKQGASGSYGQPWTEEEQVIHQPVDFNHDWRLIALFCLFWSFRDDWKSC